MLKFPTAGQVNQIRHTKECSMFEAKREAWQLQLAEAIESAENLEDIKQILTAMLPLVHFK